MGSFTNVAAKSPLLCVWGGHTPESGESGLGDTQEEFATSLGLQLLCPKPSVGGKAPPIPTLPGGKT